MTEESECGKLLLLPNNPKVSYASDSNPFFMQRRRQMF